MTRKTYTLLHGRMKFFDDQPKMRPSLDSVLLGHLLPDNFNGIVLDVGCGMGVPTLMTKYRCPQSEVWGIDIQPDLLRTAKENITINGTHVEFEEADLRDLPTEIKEIEFDAVITNPPFHTGSISPNETKDIAHRENIPLKEWIRLCLKRLRMNGLFGIVFPTERLTDVLMALEEGKMGGVEIKLIPDSHKRLTILAQKSSKKPLRILR